MATIYCFSSTGNSLYVAKRIASQIEADVVSMTTQVTVCDDTVAGFIFPTYFWGLPKTVEEFLRKLTFKEKSPYLFVVTTYGGIIMGVAHMVDKLLHPKGLSLSYFGKIHAVENYIPSPFLSVNNKPSVHQEIDRKADRAAQDISGKVKRVRDLYTPINWFVQKAYPANHKQKVDQKFCVENCNGCGTCEKICPRGNIHLVNGKPEFSGNCEVCLACFHACPNASINWKSTKGRARYLNPNITKAELIRFMNQS